jgi:hypothetical protein
MFGALCPTVLGAVVTLGPRAELWPASAVAASPTTSATIEPSLAPNVAGARTAVTVRARFSGAEGGIPAPLQKMTLLLPAGLAGTNLVWPTTPGCSKRHLLARGVRGCPASSLIGSGSALLAWKEGTKTVNERATLTAFVGSTNGEYQLQILGEGVRPIHRRYVITEPEFAMSAPYSAGLEAFVPPIPTRAGQPNASVVEFTMTIGARGGGRGRGHGAASPGLGIYVPRSCPSAGFPWTAEITYVGGATQNVAATSPCP